MTDRHSGFLVKLDQDVCEDDAQGLADAIRMLRGVRAAHYIPADPMAELWADQLAREAAIQLLREHLIESAEFD